MTIPATHAEIEQIYLAAELESCKSLCVTACQSGDGVTSLASALAERYLLAGYKTLLVDLNLFNPAFKDLEVTGAGKHVISNQTLIEHVDSHRVFMGVSVPSDNKTMLAYKDPAVMASAVAKWQMHFDRIVIDTSPLLQVNRGNIPAQSVASACDKTVLVARGGVNSHSQISAANAKLNTGNVSMLGCVLNAVDQPTLAKELSRKVSRFPFVPQSLKQRINDWLMRSEFLSQTA